MIRLPKYSATSASASFVFQLKFALGEMLNGEFGNPGALLECAAHRAGLSMRSDSLTPRAAASAATSAAERGVKPRS